MTKEKWSAPFYNIRAKVLLFGLIMSTVPLILLSVFYFFHMKEHLGSQIRAQQALKVENMSAHVTAGLSDIVNRLTLLATVQNVREQPKLFYDILKQSDAVDEIVMFDAEGRIVQKFARIALNQWSDQAVWPSQRMLTELKQSRNEVYGEVTSNRYGQPVMTCAVPIYASDETTFHGGVGIVLKLQKMVGDVSAQHLDPGEDVYVLNRDGQVMTPLSGAHRERFPGREKERDVLETRQNIDGIGFELVMVQSKSHAFTPVYDMLERGVASVGIVTILVSGISVYAGLYFTKPIEILRRAMRRLKEGKWPKRVNIRRADELGELAEAFNEMTHELKRNTQQLRQEKERLNIIVSGIGAGLAIVNEHYHVTWMNDTLKNWTQGEKHLTCYALFNDRETPCPECPAFRDEMTGDVDQLLTKVQPNGEKRIFRHRLYPLEHTLNHEKEMLVVIEDITKQRQMEEKLIQTDKLSALGLMASNFAHEVNNPLASIKVYAEDLSDRLQEEGEAFFRSDEIDDYLRIIKDHIARCKEITNHLLNFARKSEWREERFTVAHVIRDSETILRYALSRHDIAVVTEIEPDLPLISGDPMKLVQVVVNLMNNALDALEETGGGQLSVRVYLEERHIVLTVNDTGPGIPERHQSKLFDPFFTTKPAGKGTGLGLSVCYGIVQQFRGTIHVDSQPYKGTTFYVKLPV